mmetsp:Transcript_83302/g.156767  ORF Transcript_83302/g.156767 Transcript_83302/m.156767 type:complete len:598 (-) Transcript_83302:79-1872(-)
MSAGMATYDYLDREYNAKNIWDRLECEQGDRLSVAVIVKYSRYLQKVFPELLQQYAEVAERGSVSWDAFHSLYVGQAAGRDATPNACRNGTGEKKRTPEELRHLFESIDVDNSGAISLTDVIGCRELVCKELPDLLTQWAEIDADDSGSISWDEFRAFFGDVDDWLEFQLGEIVGLDDLKDQIRRFYRGVMLDKLRRQRGHSVSEHSGQCHMIFQGSPGTGKTSIARLMVRLLHRIGIAQNDKLTEVQQEQLVAGYCGQTAPKTQKVIEEATGGVLFIDEAYRLSQGTGNNDFGKEAIEQLMSAMNDPPEKAPIMIFAGYPADMKTFMAQNDGLYRRIPYTFNFPNYSCCELAEILELHVTRKGFMLEPRLLENGRQHLGSVIETNTMPRTRSLMNGGICERIFSFAKQALDARDDHTNPSVVLNCHDIAYACQQIPLPPSCKDEEGLGLQEHMKQLQDEIEKLQQENARLHAEAAQGSPEDVLRTTLKEQMDQTVLNATLVTESRGIRELLKEVRRLKAELHTSEESKRQLEIKVQQLEESLHEAEHALHPGDQVEYWSRSLDKWIPAIVQAYDQQARTYDLDVKKGVVQNRIRRI